MKITDVEAILLNPRLAARNADQKALRQDRHADPL